MNKKKFSVVVLIGDLLQVLREAEIQLSTIYLNAQESDPVLRKLLKKSRRVRRRTLEQMAFLPRRRG